VIAYRVEGSESAYKVNQAEAVVVASMLVAATEQPEYKKSDLGELTTFGVISLVGEEQALVIDSLLRRHLKPTEYEERRIVCGNAAQFQGDERDVMFLSVVDGPQEGPLALREQPLFKKRFNVAASRARNQMWVVYSLDPTIHLKPGDLRRRLIEHALDPSTLVRFLDKSEERTESEFERLVLRRLASAGYRIIPQVRVGYYRIDMVVEGNGHKLAVECDGDRYHPIEKLQEDMGRQAILERLGWTFERVRGSIFFRDPDRAMEPVFARLKKLEITPDGTQPEDPLPEQITELQDRIIRRAAELREEWAKNPEKDIESADEETPSGDAYGSRTTFQQVLESIGTGRGIDDIPQDEIRSILHQCLPNEGRIEREILLRQVAHQLGFEKLGQRIRKRLNRAIGSEVRARRVKTDWIKVWKISDLVQNQEQTE
jgi:very-short-patch-repair endonuclease